jgi:hypothetical protein
MKLNSNIKMVWRWWCKALGEKASECDKESDKIAVIRTVIFATYLITNCFIVANAVRHWNDRELNIKVEIYESPNYSEELHTKGWNSMGVDRNSRIEGVYRSGTVKTNRTGEFE